MKIPIDRKHLNNLIKDKSLNSFLDAIENKPISDGMWNKLYALLAIARKIEQNYYWIYKGLFNQYDVTNRKIEKIMHEDGLSIGEMIKDRNHK